MLCHLGYMRTWDLTTVHAKLKYAGVTDFHCEKLPQEILSFGTGIGQKNRRFSHESYPKQQNEKLEIPCKQTNQRLWVSTLLTYVDFNVISWNVMLGNFHVHLTWHYLKLSYEYILVQFLNILRFPSQSNNHYCPRTSLHSYFSLLFVNWLRLAS